MATARTVTTPTTVITATTVTNAFTNTVTTNSTNANTCAEHLTTLSCVVVVLAHLGEAEKESDPSYKAESFSSMFLDLICTGPAGVVGEASLQENKMSHTQAKKSSKCK